MSLAPTDARADLAALCERGIDWRLGAQRVLRNDAPARDAAVLVLFGLLLVFAQSSAVAPFIYTLF